MIRRGKRNQRDADDTDERKDEEDLKNRSSQILFILPFIRVIRVPLDGSNPKLNVRDDAGMKWKIKLGAEARPETAATRLVWAVGYSADEDYFLHEVLVRGMPLHLHRGQHLVGPNGTMRDVRVKREPDDRKKIGNWQWRNNPFSGTRELNGLRVLMAVINNWDLKDDNNKIIYVPASGNGVPELRYIISDLGATFGKTGGAFSRNRNEAQSFANSKFVEGVQGGNVRFAYGGKNTGLFKNITLEQTKWIGSWLSRLTDQQISDAFRAANYSPEEIETLTHAVRARIEQLITVQG